MDKIVSIFSVFLVISCSSKQEAPYPLPKDAQSMLTSDSVKRWKLASRYNNGTRMNMGDCFLSYEQTYSTKRKMQDNAGQNRECGETLKADWKFVKDGSNNYYIRLTSTQLPSLMNIKDDFKLFKIKYLSSDSLIVSFKHRQFSNKETNITDYYVPSETIVSNRDFHW